MYVYINKIKKEEEAEAEQQKCFVISFSSVWDKGANKLHTNTRNFIEAAHGWWGAGAWQCQVTSVLSPPDSLR